MGAATGTWTIGEPREVPGHILPVASATGPRGEQHTVLVISGPHAAEEGATPLWEVRDICDSRPRGGQVHVIPA